MKYCVVGPTYPFRGGVAHYTTALVRHLRARHEVRFYSYWRQYPAFLFPGSTAADPSQQRLEEACERTLDAYNPLSWWQTARRITADRPDVLLLQWWTPFWLPLLLVLSLAARRAGIPIIYLCHQLVEPDSSPLEWLTARLALRLASGIVAVSQREYDKVRSALPRHLVRLGHLPVFDSFPRHNLGRAEARRQLGLEADDTPLLLAFGFVRRYKGLRYLLQALARVPAPARLLIAGEFWEDEQDYRRLIQTLGLEERVIIHNQYIPNEAMEPYFAAANVLALPYISGSQSGVSALALHYGLPVIATSVGGLAEAIRHEESGLIVPPADSEALAAAIEHYLREGLEAPFRAAAAQARERLSWPALLAILEEMSHELTGAPGIKPASTGDAPLRADTGL